MFCFQWEQTEGKGINICTHGEMLPAPILFTTNCLMPPKESYADRVFPTEVVGYPGIYIH